MKNYALAFLMLIACSLFGCSGSDMYRGNWKATDNTGNKFELTFDPKSFSIKDMNGKVAKFDYTQNSIKIENSTRKYGIQLSDGRAYNIVFPIAGNTSEGFIALPNNETVYTISRTAYIQYQDLYKLTR